MADEVRESRLASFKRGDISVLIATAAIEEGNDVPDCYFVIRFDVMKTTKAHIQGSGRARCYNAEIYYFENDPSKECLKAEDMEAVARNEALNKSEKELRASSNARVRDELHASRSIRYPFISKGADDIAEVNIFNCLPILYQYVQEVMGQSVSPEECLFDIREEDVMSIPPTRVKTVMSVFIPTPSGVVEVSRPEVNAFWSVSIHDIVKPPERLKNMSALDIEMRRAVYVAVLRLHDMGYLSPSNQPSVQAKAGSKIACPVFHMKYRMNLKNMFSKESLLRRDDDVFSPPLSTTNIIVRSTKQPPTSSS
jgi:hypothetical protein